MTPQQKAGKQKVGANMSHCYEHSGNIFLLELHIIATMRTNESVSQSKATQSAVGQILALAFNYKATLSGQFHFTWLNQFHQVKCSTGFWGMLPAWKTLSSWQEGLLLSQLVSNNTGLSHASDSAWSCAGKIKDHVHYLFRSTHGEK